MENTIKITQSGNYTAKFEHDDIVYNIDWEDDGDTIYLCQIYGPGNENRKYFSFPVEILEPIIKILTQVKETKVETVKPKQKLQTEEEKFKDIIGKIVQEEIIKERERVKHFVHGLVQEESRKINNTWRMKSDLSPG
jgi:hypothetical protein